MTDFTTGPQRVKNVIRINKHGQRAGEKDLVVAKQIEDTDGEVTKYSYQVALFNGVVYDPHGSYSSRENLVRQSIKYQNIREEGFAQYLKYLQDRKLAYYSQANRSLLNG